MEIFGIKLQLCHSNCYGISNAKNFVRNLWLSEPTQFTIIVIHPHTKLQLFIIITEKKDELEKNK